jgi:hypothetical protein
MKYQTTNSEQKGRPSYTTTANDSVANEHRTQMLEVNLCLVPCCQCTGTYVDSISGTLLRIICSCSCHIEKQQALVQVGSHSNAIDCHHKESPKDDQQ